MPTSPELIETAFVALVQANMGLVSVLDHEPRALPKQLPAVTMLYRGWSQADELDELGPGRFISWKWSVNVYVSLVDYRKAQHAARDLCMQLCVLDKVDDDLAGTALGGWSLRDGASFDEPVFMPDDGVLLKKLDMYAVTHEQAA